MATPPPVSREPSDLGWSKPSHAVATRLGV
ncbi:Uncharacterised protein [Bordetella pertussis]|nr:Uncharacterised protein [Bordetella pertussis]CFT93921.1 Uncharacterised protein [Bordetella pertussis]CFV96025.1 Uncharacterised protein [Bordetella pertussis]